LKNLTNRLVFGTGRLHHLLFSSQREKLIKTAIDNGINKFDTAPAYGNGIDEFELGRVLKGSRDKCVINTKFGIPVPMYHSSGRHLFHLYRVADKVIGSTKNSFQKRDFRVSEMETSLHASLKRLNTDYIDTLFIHEPFHQKNLTNLPEILLFAEKLKTEGKIRFFGVAGYLKDLDKNILQSFDILQTEFSDINYLNDLSDKRIVAYSSYKYFIKDKTNSSYPDFLINNLRTHTNLEIIITSNSIQHLEKTLKVLNENSQS
jgi:aryl-alcohol dehydrogenase-like predicted oxidoreductase